MAGGDFQGAETILMGISSESTAPYWVALSILTNRMAEFQRRLTAQKIKLQEERGHHLDYIRATVETVKTHLDKGEHTAAVEFVNATKAKRPLEPVLESLLAFVNRHAKTGRPESQDLEQTLDQIIKDAIAWKSARLVNTTAAYVAFLKESSESPFADEARARIIDLEVAEIRGTNAGTLPQATEISSVRGRTYSLVNIYNNTRHDLTLRYSGPDSFKVTFAPKEKGSIEVLVGKYSIAATVSASSVRNYAGTETSTGGNFQVEYYIQNSYLPEFRYTHPDRLVYGFEPWPRKRTLPIYLK